MNKIYKLNSFLAANDGKQKCFLCLSYAKNCEKTCETCKSVEPNAKYLQDVGKNTKKYKKNKPKKHPQKKTKKNILFLASDFLSLFQNRLPRCGAEAPRQGGGLQCGTFRRRSKNGERLGGFVWFLAIWSLSFFFFFFPFFFDFKEIVELFFGFS